MILPTKHVTLRQSLLGQASIVLRHLTRPKSMSTLWSQVQVDGGIRSFDRFLLSIDLLFLLGAVELHENRLRRVKGDS